jgi:archaellum component FlaC
MKEQHRQRCRALMLKQAEITKLAMDNRTLHSELLAGEIGKLQKLTDNFIDLCVTLGRYTQYLDKEDIGEVERLQRQYEKEIASGKGATDLARKNLDVVMRRLERLREIREFVERAQRQLELIENSFALLADQIVSMRSPQELSGQLDELIDGVNAVRETAREADALLVGNSN